MTKTAEKFYMRNLSALHCVWDQAHRQWRGLALWHCISSHGALWCLCQTILRVYVFIRLVLPSPETTQKFANEI